MRKRKLETIDMWTDTPLPELCVIDPVQVSRKKVVQPNGYVYHKIYRRFNLYEDIEKCNKELAKMSARTVERAAKASRVCSKNVEIGYMSMNGKPIAVVKHLGPYYPTSQT